MDFKVVAEVLLEGVLRNLGSLRDEELLITWPIRPLGLFLCDLVQQIRVYLTRDTLAKIGEKVQLKPVLYQIHVHVPSVVVLSFGGYLQ